MEYNLKKKKKNLNNFVVCLKLTQYCKSSILQFKKKQTQDSNTDQDFSTLAQYIDTLDGIILCGGGLPGALYVYSIPSLYPLEATNTPLTKLWQLSVSRLELTVAQIMNNSLPDSD